MQCKGAGDFHTATPPNGHKEPLPHCLLVPDIPGRDSAAAPDRSRVGEGSWAGPGSWWRLCHLRAPRPPWLLPRAYFGGKAESPAWSPLSAKWTCPCSPILGPLGCCCALCPCLLGVCMCVYTYMCICVCLHVCVYESHVLGEDEFGAGPTCMQFAFVHSQPREHTHTHTCSW